MPVTASQFRPFKIQLLRSMYTQISPSNCRRIHWGIAAVAMLAMSSLVALADDDDAVSEIDPLSGMVIDENWQTVQAMCSVCHSPKLFTNYGATRATWASLIDWMQEKQGLWPLAPEIEEQILTYLEKNYPPGEVSRRRNLPVSTRPPNPYVSAAKAEFEAKRKKGEIVEPKLLKE